MEDSYSIRCPGCGVDLSPAGELQDGDRLLTVYQCDTCTRPWDLGGGESVDTALTFALDADGNMFDADTLEPWPGAGPSSN